ncbi:aadR [Symbiodinium microadriaticum]|nr:aadR [Symbiodinium microadriaticum]
MQHLANFVAGLNIPAGQELFSEDTSASSVFTVTDGAIKTYKLMPDGRRQITGFLFAGDFIGLSHGDDYIFTAEAINDVRVCRFDRNKFNSVMDQFPKMRSRLLSDASEELAAAHRQMLLLGRKTARERLATFLLMVDERTVDWRQDPDVIALPMTRGDIADYLGLTTETVSRTFTRFRSDGLIESLNGQNIRILNRDALEDQADG